MAEKQIELETPIGTEEVVTLKPAIVKVKEVNVEPVGEKKSLKVILKCKHPDAPDPIQISSCKLENKGKLTVSGLWYNTDSKKQIRKGSALATFMMSHGAAILSDLLEKEIQTIPDENGYLIFKAY